MFIQFFQRATKTSIEVERDWARARRPGLNLRLDEPGFIKARSRLTLEVSSFYQGKARARSRLGGNFNWLGFVRARPSKFEHNGLIPPLVKPVKLNKQDKNEIELFQ